METPKPVETEQMSDEELEEKKEKKKAEKLLQNERTRVSFERLQLAWIRTSVTLLVVGIGAYQYFFERIESGRTGFLKHLTGSQVGILLVMLSFVVLLFATIQHHQNMSKLKETYPEMRKSISSFLAYIIMAVSFTLSLMVIFRL
ncbi:DUF202 domain-containing protein [Aquiflexum sp. TKW24L]|uniref:YidH family protein n=1 Tax=Aquiflexum sp. TKW24L TaxID=2942212 RepID=UPI0020C0DD71|nr:DUF202 domain-containing protein [Aquiflexum sp. TKW24L]MCL6258328.1 DUF202 domain-containing protein [Aquiflexum sp. TKW24L]